MRKAEKYLIWTAFICCIAALYFIFPNFMRARTHSASAACINNLRQIESAKSQWDMENKKSTNDMAMASDLQPYMGRGSAGTLPTCPGGGRYIFGRVGETPRCSIGGPDHTVN